MEELKSPMDPNVIFSKANQILEVIDNPTENTKTE